MIYGRPRGVRRAYVRVLLSLKRALHAPLSRYGRFALYIIEDTVRTSQHPSILFGDVFACFHIMHI